MRIGIALAATVALAVSGAPAHAAKKYLDIQALEFQQSRMEQGIEAVDSEIGSTAVRVLEPQEQIKKRGAIAIMVANGSDAPFNFGPENVKIMVNEGEVARVIPYEQLAKEEKKRQEWAAVAAALGAMGNSMAASSAGYNYGTVNAYGSGGWATGSFSSYNSGQAYAAQAQASAQNQAMFEQMRVNNQAALNALNVNLRTTTVDPGQMFGGQVVFELPKSVRRAKEPVDVVLMVTAGESEHVFLAKVVTR